MAAIDNAAYKFLDDFIIKPIMRMIFILIAPFVYAQIPRTKNKVTTKKNAVQKLQTNNNHFNLFLSLKLTSIKKYPTEGIF